MVGKYGDATDLNTVLITRYNLANRRIGYKKCLGWLLLVLALHAPLLQAAAALQSKKTHINDKAKRYTIDIDKPVLGSAGKAFNTAVAQLIALQLTQFKGDINVSSSLPASLIAENQLQIDHQVVFQQQGLLSVLFKVSTYIRGQAHPNLKLFTINYAQKEDKVYKLDDIFVPGSHYLGYLSRYSILQLKQKKYEQHWLEEGAGAEPDNFSRWNLNKKGLIIHFNPYQVAAYVYGPQTVEIPYTAIISLLNPQTQLYKKLVRSKVTAS